MFSLSDLVDQCDDVLDGHKSVVNFLGSVVLEDILRRLLHCRESRSCELVGIDNDVDAVGSQLLFCDGIEA